jgi:uncharacterized membrane protein
MFGDMPELSREPSEAPVPSPIRTVMRVSIFVGIGLVVAFLAEFELFRFGKISGLTFGVSVAATIAIYSVISQLLRRAARRRGGQLTAEEKSSINNRNLQTLRQQKQLNTALLCMFSFGVLAVVANLIRTGEGAVAILVPVALLAFGIWYRTALNRAIDTLEQKIRIDTLRGY